MADAGEAVRAAAIVYDQGVDANAVLEAFTRSVAGQGWRVRGLLQRRAAADQACAGELLLIDVAGDGDWNISQKLGDHALGCRVDPQGVAEASAVLRGAIAAGTDLLVVNKFGRLEAEGGGLCDEFLAAMASGLPVLTTVHVKYLDRWRDFTGGMAELLPPDIRTVETWWRKCQSL